MKPAIINKEGDGVDSNGYRHIKKDRGEGKRNIWTESENYINKMSINIQRGTNLVFKQVRATARFCPKLQLWPERTPNVNMAIIEHI